jgi:hypothetical protein
MRYFLISTTVVILLLTACGPAAPPETVPTPPPATPTTDTAQTTFDSPLPPEVTPVPPTPTTDTSRAASEATPMPPRAEPSTPAESEDTDKGSIGDAVIVYQRSGGFAGVHEQWTVYPDGRITASDGREWQVAPERVEQLLADIEALGFFEMSGRYMPLNTCCDRFTYEITVRSGDRVHTATTIDAAPNTPAELWRVIDEISHLVTDSEED